LKAERLLSAVFGNYWRAPSLVTFAKALAYIRRPLNGNVTPAFAICNVSFYLEMDSDYVISLVPGRP